jgi:hypothetical protein
MKRILGLDVGDKTLGVAVSDELGFTAQGVTVRQRASLAADMVFLREMCALYEVAAIGHRRRKPSPSSSKSGGRRRYRSSLGMSV